MKKNCKPQKTDGFLKEKGAGLSPLKQVLKENDERAEEYVNWIQCLSCDIWVHENVHLIIDARHVTNSALAKRSSKPHQSTLKGHSTRPYTCARTWLKCSNAADHCHIGLA